MALWGYINSPFLIKFSPPSFSMRWCFVPESVITIMVARWRILKISSFLLHSSYGISLKGKAFSSCFVLFFNHWNTSAWTPGFLFYSFFIYFDAQIHPRTLSKLALVPFFYSCPIILRSLTFLFGTRFFVLILYFQCSSPGINHFIREIWFLLLEDVFRKQDLDTRYVPCYWGVTVLRLFEVRGRILF